MCGRLEQLPVPSFYRTRTVKEMAFTEKLLKDWQLPLQALEMGKSQEGW